MSSGRDSRPALPTLIARPRIARQSRLPARIRPPTESTTRSTPAARRTRHLIDPVGLGVVDAFVHAVVVESRQPAFARRGREHGRAGALGELDRCEPDAARARLDEHRFARVQVAELEQAVVGRPERDRDARDRRRDRRLRARPTSRSPGRPRARRAIPTSSSRPRAGPPAGPPRLARPRGSSPRTGNPRCAGSTSCRRRRDAACRRPRC